MSLQDKRIRLVEGLGPDFRKLDEELAHTEVFKCGTQRSRIPQTTASGVPKRGDFCQGEKIKTARGVCSFIISFMF